MPPKTSSTSRSLSWVTGSYAIANALRLVQAIIIARWLGPTEMGLYAFALTILTLIELIEQIGANQLFITQSPNNDTEEEWLQNCWTARMIMALLASLIVICVAVIAFMDERIGPILLCLSLLPPVMAMKSARMILLQKHRQFVPLAKFEMGAAVFRTVSPVVIVYFFRNTESLILANIGASVVLAVASHIVFRHAHRFLLSRSILRELVSFGSKSAYISALTTAHNTLDNLVLASALGQTALGLYSTGYRLAMTPLGLVQAVSSRILTSHYRHASDKGLDVLIDQWCFAFRFLVLFNATIMSVAILLAEPAVELVLGDEWIAAIPVIILASFTAFFRGATLSLSPLMMIRHELHWDAIMKTAEVAIFAIFIAAGYWLQSMTVFLIGGMVSYAVAFVMRVIWWRHHIVASGLSRPPSETLPMMVALSLLAVSYLATVFALPLLWVAAGVCLVTAAPILQLGKSLLKEMDK